MDVKGLSMAQLWDEAVKEFKTEEVDGLNNIIEAVKFPKEKSIINCRSNVWTV